MVFATFAIFIIIITTLAIAVSLAGVIAMMLGKNIFKAMGLTFLVVLVSFYYALNQYIH